MVKFWKFELVKDESESQARRLSFVQDKRALKVSNSSGNVSYGNYVKCISASAKNVMINGIELYFSLSNIIMAKTKTECCTFIFENN